MNDDYLWDRSGPPDPEIARLERTLAPLRYRHRAEVVTRRAQVSRAWLAVAASVVGIAAGLARLAFPAAQETGWQIASIEGGVRVGRQAAEVSMGLRRGQVLRTGSGAKITLRSDDVGRIDVGSDSELRASSTKKVALQRGQLHAFIWAPAREFVVDTPSARAVDLGCEYTLDVDAEGDGLLKVSMGWVAFRFGGLESFIPEGAACVTRKKGGPGIPYYLDSSEGLRQALGQLERGDRTAYLQVLSEARPRDGLTLWHLLTRLPEAERGVVFDRFAKLVALPSEVSREGVVKQDPKMLDLCWNALNLENTQWWRGWERKWE